MDPFQARPTWGIARIEVSGSRWAWHGRAPREGGGIPSLSGEPMEWKAEATSITAFTSRPPRHSWCFFLRARIESGGAEDAQASDGMGVELRVDFRMGDAGKVFGQECEQGVAQEREAGQHAGMAHGRMVLHHRFPCLCGVPRTEADLWCYIH